MPAPQRFFGRLLSLVAAATAAPTLAASPVLLAGLAAYLAESSAYVLYVGAFFQLIVFGIVVSLIVGVPLHAVFVTVGLRRSWAYIITGALLSVLTYALSTDYQWGEYRELLIDHSDWFWWALILFGSLTGWLFWRRAARAR